jgi:ABC-2 type transport system ATP-binding protein
MFSKAGQDVKCLISVRDLKKYFGDVKAVDDISFEVHPGEVFGLLGPNGAGKTTTIKCILGLLEPDSGSVEVLGMDSQKDEIAVKQRIGYVSDEPLIYKSLTPNEVFAFIASIRGIDGAKVQARSKTYLETLEAEKYADKLVATLSHGNKQKIQIIAALLHEPDLLIMDEPLSGLDARSVRVVKEILELHVQRGGAVLFSTHILEIAQELCTRIAIINKGKIVGIGTMDELREQSQNAGSLEEVFLRLTEQDESVTEAVEKLREAFKTTEDEA